MEPRTCFEPMAAATHQRRVPGPAASTSEPCQQRVDAKAFTGRGVLRRLREARARVDSLHGEMRELAKLTVAMPGRTMYLCMHRRARTGQVALRWRQSGVAAPHLPWPEVARLLSLYPPGLGDWYRSVNATARRLNGAEKQARASLRAARDELGTTQAEIEGA